MPRARGGGGVGVYTRDSRTTKWRNGKREEERKGSVKGWHRLEEMWKKRKGAVGGGADGDEDEEGDTATCSITCSTSAPAVNVDTSLDLGGFAEVDH